MTRRKTIVKNHKKGRGHRDDERHDRHERAAMGSGGCGGHDCRAIRLCEYEGGGVCRYRHIGVVSSEFNPRWV